MTFGTQLQPSSLLMFIAQFLRDYESGPRNEEQTSELFDFIGDLENALSHYPEAQEHLQILRTNAYAVYVMKPSADEAMNAADRALRSLGPLHEIVAKRNLG